MIVIGLALSPVAGACSELRYQDPTSLERPAEQPASIPAALSNNLRPLLSAPDRKAFTALAKDRGFVIGDEGLLVDIQTQGLGAEDRTRFELPGVRIQHFSPRHERIAAVVSDPCALRALATLDGVRHVAPAYGRARSTDRGRSRRR